MLENQLVQEGLEPFPSPLQKVLISEGEEWLSWKVWDRSGRMRRKIFHCRFFFFKKRKNLTCLEHSSQLLTPNQRSSAASSWARRTHCSVDEHRRSWPWRLYYLSGRKHWTKQQSELADAQTNIILYIIYFKNIFNVRLKINNCVLFFLMTKAPTKTPSRQPFASRTT